MRHLLRELDELDELARSPLIASDTSARRVDAISTSDVTVVAPVSGPETPLACSISDRPAYGLSDGGVPLSLRDSCYDTLPDTSEGLVLPVGRMLARARDDGV